MVILTMRGDIMWINLIGMIAAMTLSYLAYRMIRSAIQDGERLS